jgi:hypothetical protein
MTGPLLLRYGRRPLTASVPGEAGVHRPRLRSTRLVLPVALLAAFFPGPVFAQARTEATVLIGQVATALKNRRGAAVAK